jgi:hypothetical protein
MAKNRGDIQGEPRAAQAVQDFLRRVGGANPFGENNYRLVHSNSRFHLQGGKWKIWADNLTLQERGGMVTTPAGLLVPSPHTPDKVEICVKWMRKYSTDFPGWILERWMPASWYGGVDDWERLHVPMHPSIPFLGPYPSEGDYEMCTPACETEPSFEKMREAIQFQHYCDETRLRGDLNDIVRQRVWEAVEKYEAEQQAMAEENEYRIKDFLTPWKSLSLAAGRWRSRAAEKAGVKEHAGN